MQFSLQRADLLNALSVLKEPSLLLSTAEGVLQLWQERGGVYQIAELPARFDRMLSVPLEFEAAGLAEMLELATGGEELLLDLQGEVLRIGLIGPAQTTHLGSRGALPADRSFPLPAPEQSYRLSAPELALALKRLRPALPEKDDARPWRDLYAQFDAQVLSLVATDGTQFAAYQIGLERGGAEARCYLPQEAIAPLLALPATRKEGRMSVPQTLRLYLDRRYLLARIPPFFVVTPIHWETAQNRLPDIEPAFVEEPRSTAVVDANELKKALRALVETEPRLRITVSEGVLCLTSYGDQGTVNLLSVTTGEGEIVVDGVRLKSLVEPFLKGQRLGLGITSDQHPLSIDLAPYAARLYPMVHQVEA